MRSLALVLVIACSPATPPSSEPDAAPADASHDGSSGDACSGKLLGPGDYTRTIVHEGLVRTYEVHVPATYTPAARTPVVISLHGGGGNPQNHEELTRLVPTADANGFILVRPAGTGRLAGIFAWNAGNCCGAAAEDAIDDVGFVTEMLDELERDLCVDTRRVFATGHSNGGMLAYRLACELSSRIAAIAANAATMPDRSSDADPPVFACTPPRRVPILHLHGLADRAVPIAGGCPSCLEICPAAFQPVSVAIEGWRVRNGCDATTTTAMPFDGVRCERHLGCEDGGDIELCTIVGTGHNWPGGADPQTACSGLVSRFPANERIWAFFASHPM